MPGGTPLKSPPTPCLSAYWRTSTNLDLGWSSADAAWSGVVVVASGVVSTTAGACCRFGLLDCSWSVAGGIRADLHGCEAAFIHDLTLAYLRIVAIEWFRSGSSKVPESFELTSSLSFWAVTVRSTLSPAIDPVTSAIPGIAGLGLVLGLAEEIRSILVQDHDDLICLDTCNRPDEFQTGGRGCHGRISVTGYIPGMGRILCYGRIRGFALTGHNGSIFRQMRCSLQPLNYSSPILVLLADCPRDRPAVKRNTSSRGRIMYFLFKLYASNLFPPFGDRLFVICLQRASQSHLLLNKPLSSAPPAAPSVWILDGL